MIGLSCYILADTFFISKGLGDAGLTALNLAIPIFAFIHGIGLMLAYGGAANYSVCKSLGGKKDCNRIFMNMLYMALIFSLFLMGGGLFFSKNLSILLRADSSILEMTNIYIKMILIFSPAFILNNILNFFVKNDGNPKLAMIAMLLGSLFNIIFDYIFIFPLSMGMFGAVLATGFAPLAGLSVLSLHFIKKKNSFSFSKSPINIQVIKKCIPVGIPSLLTEVSSGLVIIIFNMLILKLAGNIGVAAYGIIANLSLVVLSIYIGISQGMQAILSKLYGQGKRKSIENHLRFGLYTMLFISIAIYSLLYFNANSISSIFNRDHDPELQRIAIRGIKLYFLAIPFAGFNIIISSYFASTLKAIPAQVVSILRGILLIVPIVFLMARTHQMNGIWISFPLAEILTTAIAMLFYYFHKKALAQEIPNPHILLRTSTKTK